MSILLLSLIPRRKCPFGAAKPSAPPLPTDPSQGKEQIVLGRDQCLTAGQGRCFVAVSVDLTRVIVFYGMLYRSSVYREFSKFL